MQKCWICYDRCSDKIKCNCNNNLKYCHNLCLYEWIKKSDNYHCRFCKSKYKIPFYWYIYIFFIKYINIFIDFHYFIMDYNIYTGERWDEI